MPDLPAGQRPASVAFDGVLLKGILTKLLDRMMPVAAANDVEFRLVGSASSLLRGIRIDAKDVDILLRERRGVDLLHPVVAGSDGARVVEPPVWLEEAVQYFARYVIDGVVVELSTVERPGLLDDVFECVGPGPWTHYGLVACGPYGVPAVASELRLLTELFRGRRDRTAIIAAHMRSGGADLKLIRRGMAVHGMPEDRQAQLLGELGFA